MKNYYVMNSGLFLQRCKCKAGIIQSFWAESQWLGTLYTLRGAKRWATIAKSKIFFINDQGHLEQYLYY